MSLDLVEIPPYYPVAEKDESGKVVTRMFPTQVEMEKDPERPGFMRLRQRKKGSPVRFGQSYVAAGFPANPYTIAAGVALGPTPLPIQEPGYLGRFVIQGG